MITIRPLTQNGTMVRRAIVLNLKFKPKPVLEYRAGVIADSTDSFMRNLKPARKPKEKVVANSTGKSSRKPTHVGKTKQAKQPIKANEPTAQKAVEPVDKFTHNLQVIEALPDDVLMASDKLIYGNVYGFAEDASKTPDEARSALSNLISDDDLLAKQCRQIIRAQIKKANLKGVQLFELS